MKFGTIFALQIALAVAVATSFIFVLRRYRRKAALTVEESLYIPVGVALAKQVARCLKTGLRICYQHRDYCGMGLCFMEEKYVYGPVHDGNFWPSVPGGQRLEFSSEEDFVSWLANQTNHTFGAETDPQSLTSVRLEAAIKRCRPRPSERA